MLKLTRELRFGLHPQDPPPLPNSANGFAANPALTSIAPFLTLTATLSGHLDSATGMLINIKTVDRYLRIYAIPFLRERFTANSSTPTSPNALGQSAEPSPYRGRPFGRILVKLGILTREQLHQALAYQADEKKQNRNKLIGDILIERGLITPEQRDHALLLQKSPQPFSRKNHPTEVLPELFSLVAAEFAPHTLETLSLGLSPYLALTVHKEKPDMVHLTQHFEFSAAHRLHSPTLSETQNQEIFGRCNNPNGHGHNYELEVTLAGIPNPTTGEILPIPQLQQIVNHTILDHFDHKHLNLDCPEFKDGIGLNPTVENIAKVIYQKLKPTIPAPATLHHIRIWETPKTVAEYSE